jgi:oxysterol-binding protein-related protein 9/10/11
LHIEGLYSGSPFVELNSSSYIQSSSGYTAKIDYSGRGWLSGNKNTFTASLFREGKEKDPLYKVDGRWSKGFDIKDAKSKQVIDNHDALNTKTTPLSVAPIEQQDELESRRAWQKVAQAIEKGDMETTSAEKTKIEEAQRALRRKENEEGREWERRYFTSSQECPTFEKLAARIGVTLDLDKTNVAWIFDEEKAKKATP